MALLPEDPQKRKNVLYGVVFLALIGYGGFDRLLKPRNEELTQLTARLEAIELQNTTARSILKEQGAENIERRLALYRDQLEGVERLIPSSEELPDMLDAISAEAQRAGVDLSLIQPTGATEEQFYTRRQYDVAVIGTYHGIGEFLTRVASLPRIITPSGLTLAPSAAAQGEPKLEARFSIETYVLPSPGGALATGPAPAAAATTDSAAAAAAPAPADSTASNSATEE